MRLRHVYSCKCGSNKSFDPNTKKIFGMHRVDPAAVYVDDGGILLVTSEEWVDWLIGKTDKFPD